MTDTPNTQAPAVPSFAMVKTDMPFSVFNAQAHKLHWQTVQVVDFYRTPATNKQLERVRLETAK